MKCLKCLHVIVLACSQHDSLGHTTFMPIFTGIRYILAYYNTCIHTHRSTLLQQKRNKCNNLWELLTAQQQHKGYSKPVLDGGRNPLLGLSDAGYRQHLFNHTLIILFKHRFTIVFLYTFFLNLITLIFSMCYFCCFVSYMRDFKWKQYKIIYRNKWTFI